MLKKKTRRSSEFKTNSQVIDINEARKNRRRKREEAVEKKNKVREPKTVLSGRQATKRARRKMVYSIILIIIIVIIGASAFNIVSLKFNEPKIIKEQEELLEQKARLQNEFSQINSIEYIEQKARQQLKMIKPDEILYVLPEKNKKTTNSGIIPD